MSSLRITKVAALARKEFIQFFRDRALVILVLYIFVETALCGWSLFMHVRNLPAAICDLDQSHESRELVSKFMASGAFLPSRFPLNEKEVEVLLDRGEVSMALVIPAGFSADLAAGRQAKVQLLLDGTNSQIANVALGYALGIVRSYSLNIELQRAGLSELSQSGIATISNSVRALYDPNLNFTHFNMLSMLALSAFMTGLLLTAGAVVREKEAGTLEQLMVTPVSPGELVLAKLIPMGLIKMVGLVIGMAISIFIFHVPVKGSLNLFLGLSTLIFLAAMGVGVFLATLARNMQQVLLLSFFVLFPTMFLSGTLVPIENMHPALQYLSYLSPLRYYLDITLGIFLKGVGLEALWPQTMALVVFSLAILSLGIIRFRRSLS